MSEDLRLGDRSRYTKLALDAATAYFEKGTPLVTKIASLAQANGLNNEEIRRVVEDANHMVHNTLRQKTATVEFKVATLDGVSKALGRGSAPMVHYEKAAGERTKVASEKECEDPEDAQRSRTTKRLADKKKAEKEAEQIKEADGDRQIAHEKLAHAKGEFLMALQRHVMDEGGDLVKAAHDFATYPPLAAAPKLLLEVMAITKLAGSRMRQEVVFNDATMAALTPEGLKKTADQMDPTLYQAGLHIGGQPIEIVRGNHQVWLTLDTLVDQYHTAYPPLTRGPFGGEGRVNYGVAGVKTREISDANHEAARAI